MNGSITVSICCLTYNHEKYIRQCLDGLIMQKTEFDFEILVHDDASSDATQSIINEYVVAYPNLIKPILQIRNQYSQGISPLRQILFPLVKGKYVALCEGDEYWTDPLKLQKQVNAMESDHSLAGCAHQSLVFYENGTPSHMFHHVKKQILKTKDLLDVRLFHTASFLFKKEVLDYIKDFNSSLYAGDRFLFLACSLKGNILYMPDVMCCYRKNAMGVTSRVSYSLHVLDLKVPEYFHNKDLKFPYYRYLAFVHRAIFSESLDISLKKYIYHFTLFVKYSFSYFPKNLKDIYKALYVSFWWLTKGQKYRIK